MHQIQNIPLTKKNSCHEKKPRFIYHEFLRPFLKSHPLLPSVEFKNDRSYIPTPLYSFMAWERELYSCQQVNRNFRCLHLKVHKTNINILCTAWRNITRSNTVKHKFQFEGGQDVQLKW
jgi:hypothetical protein